MVSSLPNSAQSAQSESFRENLVDEIRNDSKTINTYLNNMKPPELIFAAEGLPGSGKTTVLKAMENNLNRVTKVLYVSSGGSSPPEGFKFWEFRKYGLGLFRFFEDPIGVLWWLHFQQKRLLASRFWEAYTGVWMLDRYLSSVELQISLASNYRYEGAEEIFDFARIILTKYFPQPDLILYLDLEPSSALQRLIKRKRKNQIIIHPSDYVTAQHVRAFYLAQFRLNPKKWAMVDANHNSHLVFLACRKTFQKRKLPFF